jgi:hypothetical protein
VRVTRAQLTQRLAQVATLSVRAGMMLPGDQLRLVAGGSTTGVQVWLIKEGESGYCRAPFGPSSGIIGMTKPEALRTLEVVAITLAAMTE